MRWIITAIGSAIIFGLVAFAAHDCAPKKPKIEGDKPKEKLQEGRWA